MESIASNFFAHFIQYLESVIALYDAYAKSVTQPSHQEFWQELSAYKKAQINVLKRLEADPTIAPSSNRKFKRNRRQQQLIPTITNTFLNESIESLTAKLEQLDSRCVTHLSALLSAQHIETNAVQKELFTISEHCSERIKQTFENLRQDTHGHLLQVKHCIRYEQKELTDEHTTVLLDHPPQM